MADVSSVDVIVNDTTVVRTEGDLAETETRGIQHGTDSTWVLAQGVFVLRKHTGTRPF